jgi:hypothetical protein
MLHQWLRESPKHAPYNTVASVAVGPNTNTLGMCRRREVKPRTPRGEGDTSIVCQLRLTAVGQLSSQLTIQFKPASSLTTPQAILHEGNGMQEMVYVHGVEMEQRKA